MNRKLLIAGVVLGLVLILGIIALVATGGKKKEKNQPQLSSDNITLTYWRAFDDKDSFDDLIQEYQNRHSNIKIEYKKIGIKDYEKTVVEALAGGKGPDIFAVHNDWMPKFFDKINPIDENQFSVNDYERVYFKSAVTDNIKDNRIYAIPLSTDNLALYVNSDLMTKAEIDTPPATWEDIVGKEGDPNKPGMLPKLNNRQGNTFNQSAIALGNNTVNRSPDVLALMMLQQLTPMTNDDHSVATFNLTSKVEGISPDPHLGTDALRFYTSFANPAKFNYSWNAQMGDSVKAFADGRVAMMVNYAYQIPTLKRLNPNLNYRIMKAPQIGGRDPVNYASYWDEVVSRTSPHSKEAWDFLRFISDSERVYKYNEKSQTVSARQDVQSIGELQTFYDQAKDGNAISWYKGDYLKADQIFVDMITQVLGGEDAQRAIDAAAQRETTVLKSLNGTQP